MWAFMGGALFGMCFLALVQRLALLIGVYVLDSSVYITREEE